MTFRQEMESAHGKDFISVHEGSMAIDKDDPVCISVEGDSEVCLFLEDVAR